MTPAALRDAFAACLAAGGCTLCGRPLDGEADWIDDEVRCVDCGRVHSDPTAPRAHATWRPEAARRWRATAPPDLDGGP